MKFKEYLNEKITSKEFDASLSNKNIKAGCEFEIYLTDAAAASSGGFDRSDLDDLIDRSDRQISKAEENVDKYNEAVEQIYEDEKEFKEKLYEIDEKIEEIDEKIEEIDDNIEEKKDDITDLESEKKDDDADLDELNANIKKLEAEKKELETDKEKLELENKEFDDEKDDIEEEIRRIDNGERLEEIEEETEKYQTIQTLYSFFGVVDYLEENEIMYFDMSNDDTNQTLFEIYGEGDEIPSDTDELLNLLYDDVYSIDDLITSYEENSEGGVPDKDDIADMDFPFDLSDWEVEEDGSLGGGGVEIITPVKQVGELVDIIKDVFDWIDSNGSTDSSTGFHVHMSMDTKQEIDPLKLLLFMEEGLVYKFFKERKYNAYATGIMKGHFSKLEPFTHDNIIDIVKKGKLEKDMNTDKYLGMHLIDLENNHVEFRYMGGADYHKKFKEVRKVIANYAYWLSIACDPTFKKKEYILKVNKLTNRFNYFYLSTVIERFEFKKDIQFKITDTRDVSAKDIKIWEKKADKIINPFKQKLKGLPKSKGKIDSDSLDKAARDITDKLIDELGDI